MKKLIKASEIIEYNRSYNKFWINQIKNMEYKFVSPIINALKKSINKINSNTTAG
jgi:hypothetical protein